MSKHQSRRERWTQESGHAYRSAFGRVELVRGKWQAWVCWQKLEPETGAWIDQGRFLGEAKRPRNAMMRVEDEARTIARQADPDVVVAFEA